MCTEKNNYNGWGEELLTNWSDEELSQEWSDDNLKDWDNDLKEAEKEWEEALNNPPKGKKNVVIKKKIQPFRPIRK